MPAASSNASSPLSAASTASFRTAVIRTLMETDPRPRATPPFLQQFMPDHSQGTGGKLGVLQEIRIREYW
jgi:hypothetical protein